MAAGGIPRYAYEGEKAPGGVSREVSLSHCYLNPKWAVQVLNDVRCVALVLRSGMTCPSSDSESSNHPKSIEQARAEMLAEREYQIYLTTFDSRKRLPALMEIMPRLNDDEYWTVLRELWISSELILRLPKSAPLRCSQRSKLFAPRQLSH